MQEQEIQREIPPKLQNPKQSLDPNTVFADNIQDIILKYCEFKKDNLSALEPELSQEIKKEATILEANLVSSISGIKTELEKTISDASIVYKELKSKMLEYIDQQRTSQFLSLEIYGGYANNPREQRSKQNWLLYNHNKKIGIDAFVAKIRSLSYEVDDLGIDESSIKFIYDDDPSWGCCTDHYEGGEYYRLRIKMQ